MEEVVARGADERCDKLLARRVARDEGAVQAGVPISFIAMFGGQPSKKAARFSIPSRQCGH